MSRKRTAVWNLNFFLAYIAGLCHAQTRKVLKAITTVRHVKGEIDSWEISSVGVIP
jgi:hypothetical protein